MLGFLLRRVHLASLFPEWSIRTLAYLVAGLAITGLGVVLATWRWQCVLEALELPQPLRPLLGHYLAGLFVGNFLPSTVGGDVLRTRRLSAATGESEVSFASVVIERLTGWIVLPVLSLMAFVVNRGLLRFGRSSSVAFAVTAATLLALVGVLAAAGSPRIGGRLAGHSSWLRFLGAVHLGIDRLRRHRRLTGNVLFAGFLYQLVVVAAAWLTARALGVQLSSTAALAFVPIVAIVQVLPISVGGLGLREQAFTLFLHPLGVPTGRAVALGLLLYGMNLAASLAGAPAFAFGQRKAVPA